MLYGVRIGNVPCAYSSWKAAWLQIIECAERGQTLQKAATSIRCRQKGNHSWPTPPPLFPTVYTDGYASRASCSAGWGVHVQLHPNSSVALWGPVVTDRMTVDWIGASRPSNNTGEVSAFYHPV